MKIAAGFFNLISAKVPTCNFGWRRAFSSQYFRSAGSYLVLKFILFSVAGLICRSMLAKGLTREDYGLITWVLSIIATLSPFGMPGISSSITAATANGYDANFRRGTWIQLAGGAVGGLVLFCLSLYFSFRTGQKTTASLFAIAGVFAPGLWLTSFQSWWNGKKDFKSLFWWTVIERILEVLVIAVVLCYTSNPVWIFLPLIGINSIASIVSSLVMVFFGGLNNQYQAKYTSYGMFVNYFTLLGVFTSQFDKIIVGSFIGLDKLAILAIGELMYSYTYAVPKTFLEQIFLPLLAEMHVSDASAWIQKRQPLLVIIMITGLCGVGLIIPFLYSTLFSAKYSDSISYAYLYLMASAASSPTLLVGTLMRAHTMKRETAYSQMVTSGAVFSLLFPFIYMFGLKGIVFTKIAQFIFLSLYYNKILKRYAISGAST